MAFQDETTEYDEAFSLEDILAEYGSSREQKLMEDVERAIQPPTPPEEAPETPEPPPEPVPEEPPELPPAPKPISLEEVVGSTVDAVMEERKEEDGVVLLKPKRGLFSRRKLEDTEQLYDHDEPEPEPEIEPIGPSWSRLRLRSSTGRTIGGSMPRCSRRL